jgi:hypothetical protein
MTKLTTSRRFWTFVVAQLIAGLVLVFSHSLTISPDVQTYIITTVEGLAGILIAAYTVDDVSSNVTAIKAGVHPDYPLSPPFDQSGKVLIAPGADRSQGVG